MPKICVSRLCLCCLSILYGVSPDLLGRYKSRASFGFLNRSSQMRRYLPLTAIWTGVSPRWDKQTRVKTGVKWGVRETSFHRMIVFQENIMYFNSCQSEDLRGKKWVCLHKPYVLFPYFTKSDYWISLLTSFPCKSIWTRSDFSVA